MSAEFTSPSIPARLGIVQRVLPVYRVPFFEALATACRHGLGVFAGQPRPDEAIESAEQLEDCPVVPGRKSSFFQGKLYLCAQFGLIAWLEALAAGCADPGSQPALPLHPGRRALDAPAAAPGHRLGAGRAGCYRGILRPALGCPAAVF